MEDNNYLQSLEDFSSSLIAACGDEGLQDVAPGWIGRESQQVGRAQCTQAAEEQRALLKPGQRLDQARAVVADRRQRDLRMVAPPQRSDPHTCNKAAPQRCTDDLKKKQPLPQLVGHLPRSVCCPLLSLSGNTPRRWAGTWRVGGSWCGGSPAQRSEKPERQHTHRLSISHKSSTERLH